MEAFSLLEVNQYVKRVLALNFEDPFWVECEINQVSHSKGNVYLELIEKAEESHEIVAKNSAQIWYRQHNFIRKKLGKLASAIIAAGIKVKVKVNLNYSERYGLSLVVEDIDPAYTFGQFEMDRQKTIEQLKAKDLLERNSILELPTVIQKIAVISSSTAAGFQDFMEQLNDNPYGYAFEVVLYNSAMQGQNTETEVTASLKEANEEGYDIIVIVRGGGSKLDLSAFDNYNIAFEVAMSEMPVITGIGHDIDQTVADLVAHTVLKTPTAVADWIVNHNMEFESALLYIEDQIITLVKERLTHHVEHLQIFEERLKQLPSSTLSLHKQLLANIESIIQTQATSRLVQSRLQLQLLEGQLSLLDPAHVLERGYAIVRDKGSIIPDAASCKKSSTNLDIQFRDGNISVTKAESNA